jgi:diguanylate cyclase (GGDEF)-like protein
MNAWEMSGGLVRLVVLAGTLVYVPVLHRWAGGRVRAYLAVMGGLSLLILAEATDWAASQGSGPLGIASLIRDTDYVHALGYVAVLFGVVAWVQDFRRARSGLMRHKKRLEKLAATDFLTELVNRRAAMLHIRRAMALARRQGTPLGFIMMDLDHFKQVNDTHGHQAGDAVLAHVAKVLKGRMRESDLLVRYGGEEFLVVLPDADLRDTVKVAEMLRGMIQDNPATCGAVEVPIRASLGVCAAQPGQDVTIDEAINRADEALYAAKASGRNRVVAWEDVFGRPAEPATTAAGSTAQPTVS